MGMMNLPEMRRIYRVQRFDSGSRSLQFSAPWPSVCRGRHLGIGLSLLWLIAVATHPQMPTLGREPGTQVSGRHREPGRRADPGRSRRPARRRPLSSPAADALEDRIRTVIQFREPPACVVLDCEGINFLDSQGSATIDDLLVLCRRRTSPSGSPGSSRVSARCWNGKG